MFDIKSSVEVLLAELNSIKHEDAWYKIYSDNDLIKYLDAILTVNKYKG